MVAKNKTVTHEGVREKLAKGDCAICGKPVTKGQRSMRDEDFIYHAACLPDGLLDSLREKLAAGVLGYSQATLGQAIQARKNTLAMQGGLAKLAKVCAGKQLTIVKKAIKDAKDADMMIQGFIDALTIGIDNAMQDILEIDGVSGRKNPAKGDCAICGKPVTKGQRSMRDEDFIYHAACLPDGKLSEKLLDSLRKNPVSDQEFAKYCREKGKFYFCPKCNKRRLFSGGYCDECGCSEERS